jgi:hypothetical protein
LIAKVNTWAEFTFRKKPRGWPLGDGPSNPESFGEARVKHQKETMLHKAKTKLVMNRFDAVKAN